MTTCKRGGTISLSCRCAVWTCLLRASWLSIRVFWSIADVDADVDADVVADVGADLNKGPPSEVEGDMKAGSILAPSLTAAESIRSGQVFGQR